MTVAAISHEVAERCLCHIREFRGTARVIRIGEAKIQKAKGELVEANLGTPRARCG